MRRIAATLVAWGPLGLFLLAIVDSVGLPVVGGVDALVVTVAVRRPNEAYFSAMCAVLGSIIGTLILFGIARKGGEVFLQKQISRRRGARLHAWFQRYGLVTVFIPAVSPLPLPTKIPVFCAGALKVRWSFFTAIILAARLVRYFSLAYLGKRYGQRTFDYLFAHAFVVIGIAVGLAALFGLVIWFIDKYEMPERRSHARS